LNTWVQQFLKLSILPSKHVVIQYPFMKFPLKDMMRSLCSLYVFVGRCPVILCEKLVLGLNAFKYLELSTIFKKASPIDRSDS
jgi:hypothetical protein